MIATLIALSLLCLYGMEWGQEKALPDYLSKDRKNAVNGVFILIVFLSHIKFYITMSGHKYHSLGDMIYYRFFAMIGQLMVVMFLFYSGYGVMESIKKKGKPYIDNMPKKRILTTLKNFDIAIVIYLLVNIMLGNAITVKQFVLSLIAYEDIGNSNWYIFVILLCYFIHWISAKAILFTHRTTFVFSLWGMTLLNGLVLCQVKEPWWYNTLWAYPCGVFFSLYKQQIEGIVMKHFLLTVIVLSVLFLGIYLLTEDMMGIRTNALSVVYALGVVVMSMRIKIGNRILCWMGKHLFPIYIYQHVPMMVFSVVLPVWVLRDYPLAYILICFTFTMVITQVYSYFSSK